MANLVNRRKNFPVGNADTRTRFLGLWAIGHQFFDQLISITKNVVTKLLTIGDPPRPFGDPTRPFGDLNKTSFEIM